MLALLAGALGACVTVPAPLQGQFAPVTPRDAAASSGQAAAVRWGGEIINVDPRADQTCFEILARELDAIGASGLARSEPGTFPCLPQRLLRSGRIQAGPRHHDRRPAERQRAAAKSATFDYTYPRVAADAVYLWPKRTYYAAIPYYDPWYGPWWGYGPYWGRYWGGTTVIVEHPHH